MERHRPALFLTKTWGWSPETHPTFGFSKEGARFKFLREAKPGDWIVIAGTKEPPTAPHEQGRLLGMCRVGHEKVDGAAIMRAIGTELTDAELDEDGRYRWPWAMPIVEAVRFSPQPDTKKLLGSYFAGQEWAAYALGVEERLGLEAGEKILALPSVPCAIARIPMLDREVAYSEAMALQRKYGASGPPPSAARSGSERELGIGYAYAFSLVGGLIGGAIKVGSTRDPKERLRQLNTELRFHLTGCKWEFRLGQIFPSETYAYRFEQMLLRQLQGRLVPGDREVVAMPYQEFEREWTNLLIGKQWTLPNEVG
jgi:hypothetical protein